MKLFEDKTENVSISSKTSAKTENGLSQAQLARHLGLTPSTLNRYLKGEREPPADVAKELKNWHFDETAGRYGQWFPVKNKED